MKKHTLQLVISAEIEPHLVRQLAEALQRLHQEQKVFKDPNEKHRIDSNAICGTLIEIYTPAQQYISKLVLILDWKWLIIRNATLEDLLTAATIYADAAEALYKEAVAQMEFSRQSSGGLKVSSKNLRHIGRNRLARSLRSITMRQIKQPR